MFTGIVEEVGIVKSMPGRRLTVSATKALEGMKVGDSMAINGACLTITHLDSDSFSVEVMPETLRRTNLGLLHPGDGVNLERPLMVGGRLGGHLVQGHVDATGRVISMVREEEAVLARYSAPEEVMRYVVEKGFIAVDGVSLTVIDYEATSFRVSLVSYTLEHTILGRKRPGDVVNLEADVMAKYVEKLIGKDRGGITLEFLTQHGFLS